jgi:hypothetical protein
MGMESPFPGYIGRGSQITSGFFNLRPSLEVTVYVIAPLNPMDPFFANGPVKKNGDALRPFLRINPTKEEWQVLHDFDHRSFSHGMRSFHPNLL